MNLRVCLANRIVVLPIVCLFLVGAAQAATFTVQKTSDEPDANPGNGICFTATGDCTLRAAIEEANAFVGFDTIEFAVAGAGGRTISPTSPLPTITERALVDGWSQGGFGYTGSPLVEINGTNAGAAANGLTVVGSTVTIRGLTINRFSAYGIATSFPATSGRAFIFPARRRLATSSAETTSGRTRPARRQSATTRASAWQSARHRTSSAATRRTTAT